MKVLIVGGGAAGIGAAIWLKKFDVPFEWVGLTFGGTLERVHNTIDDFPPNSWPNGHTLCASFQHFLNAANLSMQIRQIDSIWQTPRGWRVATETTSDEYEAVVLATGTRPKVWQVQGHDQVTDRLRLSSAKEPAEFKGERVAIIGGGDGAMEAALRLAEHCDGVDVFVRHRLSARPAFIEAAAHNPKIDIHLQTTITKAERNGAGCRLSTDAHTWEVAAIYLKLGVQPNLPTLNPALATDEAGFVLVDSKKQSSHPGLFAVGDVSSCTMRSVTNALADGAICARALADSYESIRLKTR